MFVGARFILGFGGISVTPCHVQMNLKQEADTPLVMIDHGSAPLLVTELAHTQHRARLTAVYNSTWYLGP